MKPWWLKTSLRDGEDGGEGSGAGSAGSGEGGAAAAGGASAAAGAGDAAAPPIAGNGEPKAPVAIPADWPTDWHLKAAGGDAKKAEQLARYASPTAVADALLAAQQKIRTGEYKQALGKDAKPEEIAAYRAAHGIPETPDKYDLTALEIADGEKELIGKFAAAGHAVHMTPAQLTHALKAFKDLTAEKRNAELAQDQQAAESAEDVLRKEWGDHYRGHMSLLDSFLDGAGIDGFKQNLLHGRLADGTPIGSSPAALKFIIGMALKDNPLGIVAPSGETVMGQNALAEYTEMRKHINDKDFKNDPAKQARFRGLIDNLHSRGLIDAQGNVKNAA